MNITSLMKSQINLFLFLFLFFLMNLLVIQRFGFTPLVMDDEVSYVVNTHNLTSLFNNQVLPALPFSQRPLGYSLLLVPLYNLLSLQGLNIARNTYNLFLVVNVCLSSVTLFLTYSYLKKTIEPRLAYLYIPLLGVIALFPPFFYYNFFSLTEAFITLITVFQLLLAYFALKNVHSSYFPIHLFLLSFLSFLFIITKETGIISIAIPLWVSGYWALQFVQKNRRTLLMFLLPLVIFIFIGGLVISYQEVARIVLQASFFDRGGNVSLTSFISQVSHLNSFLKIAQSFILILFGHLMYISTQTMGFFWGSITYFKKYQLKDVLPLQPKVSLHLLSIILVIGSLLLSTTYFSFYSSLGTLRYDHFFYERYIYPFLLFYMITLIPLFIDVLKKTRMLYFILAIVNASLLFLISYFNTLPINNLNIPSLYHLLNPSIEALFYLILFTLAIIVLIYTSRRQGNKTSYSLIATLTPISVMVCLFIYNNVFLLKRNYIFEQYRNLSLNEIHSYVLNDVQELEKMCYYQGGKISFQYWHHRYYLTFAGIDSYIVDDSNLENCNAVIVDEGILNNQHFTLKKKLTGANTKLYLKNK